MAKAIDFFKRKQQEQLDPKVNLALRDMAGWPSESHHLDGFKSRRRIVTIHRDPNGRVIGSVENIDEDEYHQYSDNWGK